MRMLPKRHRSVFYGGGGCHPSWNEVGGVNLPILVYLVMEENKGYPEGSLFGGK